MHVFSLSYIFTSGSSDSNSKEQQWRATTTRMRLPGHKRSGNASPHELCWGRDDERRCGAEQVQALQALQTLQTLQTLQVLQASDALQPPHVLRTLQAVRTSQAVQTLQAVQVLQTLQVLQGLQALLRADDDAAVTWQVARQAADDELPPIVHPGAFWEVRHGALRLQLSWRSFASAASAAASAWRKAVASGRSTPDAPSGRSTLDAPPPLNRQDSGAVEEGADGDDGGGSVGAAKAWVVLEKALMQPTTASLSRPNSGVRGPLLIPRPPGYGVALPDAPPDA